MGNMNTLNKRRCNYICNWRTWRFPENPVFPGSSSVLQTNKSAGSAESRSIWTPSISSPSSTWIQQYSQINPLCTLFKLFRIISPSSWWRNLIFRKMTTQRIEDIKWNATCMAVDSTMHVGRKITRNSVNILDWILLHLTSFF